MFFPLHGNPSSVLKFRFTAASLFLLVGPSGLEPPTLRLSGARSSLLSYGPIFRTRTTSTKEMTFDLANIPCTNLLRSRSFQSRTTMTLDLTNIPCAMFYVSARFGRVQRFTSLRSYRFSALASMRCTTFLRLVEVRGFEPLTPCLQGRCSPN